MLQILTKSITDDLSGLYQSDYELNVAETSVFTSSTVSVRVTETVGDISGRSFTW